MRIRKALMAVLCLGICFPLFSGIAEAKGGKDMVQEKTAYITRCGYVSSGSSTGGYERIELTRVSDSEANYKSSGKDWHSSPERTVDKNISADVLKRWKNWAGSIKSLNGNPFAKVRYLPWTLQV